MANDLKPVRILLVDDSPTFLKSVWDFLSHRPNLTVAGWARNGEEALTLVGELAPDLVLMDVVMPNMNGLEATHEIKKIAPATKVLFLTLYANRAFQTAARRAGADGFLNKTEVPQRLLAAIAELFPHVAPGLTPPA